MAPYLKNIPGGDSMFVAHIRESNHIKQSVQEHLENVALIARMHGESIGFGAHAELAGFLHDMGKFTKHFTTYIENAVIHGNVATKKIDHSTAGAKYLYDNFYNKTGEQNFVVEIIGMAILSHHSGLQNFIQIDLNESDYIRRVIQKDLPYYEEVKSNFELNGENILRVKRLMVEAVEEFKEFILNIKHLSHPYTYINYLQKLILSILLDADRTDTRRFEENDFSPLQQEFPFKKTYETLMETIQSFGVSKKPINILRSKMSESCDIKATDKSGIYTLSIPTGGGKTFASLRYALKHAYLYDKKRIIYIVPYTTILEQNAQAVRNIIKDNQAVLEHHANIIDEIDTEEDYYDNSIIKKMQLARDNWDHPIIFTTMVQFLDAFFQKGTRKTRRLHRLTNSIIVFDEVQSVPYQHFSLFNTAVNFLHHIGKSSIVLCTATQPTVGKMDYSITLSHPAEIVSDLENVSKAFERVTIHNMVNKSGLNAEELANKVLNEMIQKQSALIILNTKSAVRKLFEQLEAQSDTKVYHLSTSMCPAHRQTILEEIREKLGKERIICVSTQLIEAGVDISFETVFRSLAGLDSIAQAAGRCNRNAEVERGDVYIFKSSDENLKYLPEIRIGAEVMENHILPNENFVKDLLNPNVIETYFYEYDSQAKRELLVNPKGLDYSLIELINGKVNNRAKTMSLSSFKTLEQHFEAISSPTKSVLVPYDDEAKELIALLNEDVSLDEFNQLIKRAQRFSVNVFDYELQQLQNEDLIYELYKGGILAVRSEGYNKMYGLSSKGEGTKDEYLF